MRLIDGDALLNDAMKRYCKNCDRRKGIKNGKWRIIYEIGDAPCRACEVDDMKCEIEDAPTVDAVSVIRCKNCKYVGTDATCCLVCKREGMGLRPFHVYHDDFCSYAERRDDEN